MRLFAPDVTLSRLRPFGLLLETEEGQRDFRYFPPSVVRDLLAAEPYVVFRGFTPLEYTDFRAYCRELGGELSSIREIVVHHAPESYRFSRSRVPLQCAEVIEGRVARFAAVQCFGAQSPGTGGQTVLSDTGQAFRNASIPQRERWRGTRIGYRVSERAGRYLETAVDLVGRHPRSGEPVLRYAEQFRHRDGLGTVSATIDGMSDKATSAIVADLDEALYADDVCVAHSWQCYDVMFTDEQRLLRGRRPIHDPDCPPLHLQEVLMFGESGPATPGSAG